MRAFYEHFFGYAMKICLRYSKNEDEAMEILNDGFLKIFKNLKNLKDEQALKGWLSKTMVNTAIDYYRAGTKYKDIPMEEIREKETPTVEDTLHKLSAEAILSLVMELPYPHKVIFNLFVVEGYSHREIGEQLGLGESTSRSYLARANQMLREKIVALEIILS
jgi:RNA polymerase sigma-70 factor (ECF subfamily)